jgi:hypothetical protein
MLVDKQLKISFHEFCEREFPKKIIKDNIKNHEEWFFVQAGTCLGENLHYEFSEGKVQLHIEGPNWVPISKFLKENIKNELLEPQKWSHDDCAWILNKSINDQNELFEAFKKIKEIIEPIIIDFEQSSQNEKKEDSIENIDFMTEKLGTVFGLNLNKGIFRYKLIIPEYQRAYEWKTEHVKNLLDDTFTASLNSKPYLLGTLILYKSRDKGVDSDVDEDAEIVDGQQRLITLTILLNILEEKGELSLLDAEFDNQKSFYYINNTKNIVTNFLLNKTEDEKKKYLSYLKSEISFSILILSGPNAYDEAYTFFDSLNSKGKGLSDFDLLKAHHLMYIPEEQETLARKHNDYWQSQDNRHTTIFNLLLRIRMWSRGQERDSNEDRNYYHEFISKIEPNELEQQEHHFNRYMQPNVFRSWHRENDEVILNMKYPQQNMEELLPMEIPQTIEGGDAFFLYAKRYHDMFNKLFENNQEDTSTGIKYISNLAKAISNGYLSTAFEAAVLLYYDKFGENRLIEAATCIELIVSGRRFQWGSTRPSPIRIESMLSWIKEKDIIPIILNSTIASHVIYQLNNIIIEKRRTNNKDNYKSPTLTNYLLYIKSFYKLNQSKIKNTILREKVSKIYPKE